MVTVATAGVAAAGMVTAGVFKADALGRADSIGQRAISIGQ